MVEHHESNSERHKLVINDFMNCLKQRRKEPLDQSKVVVKHVIDFESKSETPKTAFIVNQKTPLSKKIEYPGLFFEKVSSH